jgi:hypothetical protein
MGGDSVGTKSATAWVVFGASVWVVATGGLTLLAGPLFGSSELVYWLSSITISVLFVFLFVLAARWTRTPRHEWVRAAALFAVPGLFGEVTVMLNFGAAVPSLPMQEASRYAAFLFFGYATLLTTAAWASSTR